MQRDVFKISAHFLSIEDVKENLVSMLVELIKFTKVKLSINEHSEPILHQCDSLILQFELFINQLWKIISQLSKQNHISLVLLILPFLLLSLVCLSVKFLSFHIELVMDSLLLPLLSTFVIYDIA